MRVYCPNCGSDNEGTPGARLTCHACTASFEVPREGGTLPPAPAPVISQASRPSAPPPTVRPTGYAGPPPSGFGVGTMQSSAPTNTLAIVSVVLGVLCCVPFSGLGAVITGVMARNQIAASAGSQKGNELALVGIVLGGLTMALAFSGFLLQLLTRGLS